MDLRLVIVFCCAVLHLELVQCYRAVKRAPVAATKTFGSTTAASSSAKKSPLLEIVLRILDSIQIVPKKRSRRQEQSQTLPVQHEDNVSRGPSPLPPLFGSALFGGRVEKPLLALSLESGEAVTVGAPSPVDQFGDEEEEFYPRKGHSLRRITSSRRFYDMVLGVLQVLETQARQKVQRAREQRESVRSTYDGEEDEQPA